MDIDEEPENEIEAMEMQKLLTEEVLNTIHSEEVTLFILLQHVPHCKFAFSFYYVFIYNMTIHIF